MTTSFIFGTSRGGLPISAYRFSQPQNLQSQHTHAESERPHVLILGGVHGDEVEGVFAALGIYALFEKQYSFEFDLTLIPMFNPDGVLNKNRLNAAGVDLNRNLATRDWSPEIATPRYHPGPHAGSEPENQALCSFLKQIKPVMLYSLHSWKPMLNVNGECRKVAEVIAAATGYIIEESIGYPTPGCLGTYAGLERSIPTLTYEIERGLSAEKILAIHVPAIVDSLNVL